MFTFMQWLKEQPQVNPFQRSTQQSNRLRDKMLQPYHGNLPSEQPNHSSETHDCYITHEKNGGGNVTFYCKKTKQCHGLIRFGGNPSHKEITIRHAITKPSGSLHGHQLYTHLLDNGHTLHSDTSLNPASLKMWKHLCGHSKTTVVCHDGTSVTTNNIESLCGKHNRFTAKKET